MELVIDLKRSICALFEVHPDEKSVQRVVTPLEYPGSGDRIVIRVRPREGGFSIDENGEAALYASLNGGDIEAESVSRWAEVLGNHGPVDLSDDDVLSAFANDERLVAPYIFRVADAAQQLYSIATSRAERQSGDFRERVARAITSAAKSLGIEVESDATLPIPGGMIADHVLGLRVPLIVITATSAARLLEAEVICMQYRLQKKPGVVMAIAESQASVGKSQFERAGYFTDRTVVYDEDALTQLVALQAAEA